MKYKVHRLDVTSDTMQEKLEHFLNSLKGEVISVVPNIKPTLLILGGTAKIDYLLIVEIVK